MERIKLEKEIGAKSCATSWTLFSIYIYKMQCFEQGSDMIKFALKILFLLPCGE